MKKFKFDFNMSAWITGVEITAESYEEAKKEFDNMTVEDLIDDGYVKDFNITDLDVEEGEEY